MPLLLDALAIATQGIFSISQGTSSTPESNDSEAYQVITIGSVRRVTKAMSTGFVNLAIRQGETTTKTFVFRHGIIADGAATSASSTLSVKGLPVALANGQTLEFKDSSGTTTGTLTLNSNAGVAATSISGTITGVIASGDTASGPLIDLSGQSWRGQIKKTHSDETAIATIGFDTTNTASGEISLTFSSDVFEDQDFNITVKDWQGIENLFPSARVAKDFNKINKLLPSANPFYVFDVETYDGSTVKRRLEGCVALIAETTTAPS